MTRSPQSGFTLIELVVAISISAIVVGFIVMFLVTPVDAYMAQSRRAELVTEANMVASNMAADLRTAVLGQVSYTNSGAEVLQITFTAPLPPVIYRCDAGAGTVTRSVGATSGLLARDVSFCRINYITGNSLHDRLVGLQLTLMRDRETMIVFRQMPLMN